MAAKKVMLTQEGLEKLKQELEFLSNEKRAEILARLAEARAQGDLSENAEYEQAREDQAKNEGRILELKAEIENAQIIEKAEGGVVGIGSTVVLLDTEFNEEETYSIVGTTEADPFNNKISNESPVGAAIIGHAVGEDVTVVTPGGDLVYKIVSIK
ncbi:MAG: transcription elongation factor GreA [Phascolarctobacterium sp.]|nr:transcription elongation factor GreA [Phascolarctobacterium sp.]